MAFTSDDLVSGVRRLAYLPDAGAVTDAEILAIADSATETLIASRVKAAREEHWIKSEDTTIASGVLRYRLPRRALGRAAASIKLVHIASGAIVDLTETTGAIAGQWIGASWPAMGGYYYVEDDFLVFPVQPPLGYALRVRYLRRPNRLVPVASGAAIVKTLSAFELQLSTAPTWLSALSTPLYVDIVRGDAPFDLMYVDLVASSYKAGPSRVDFNGNVLTASDFVDLTMIANNRVDYVCQRDQTVYPQLPVELHPVLEAAVARTIAKQLTDQKAIEATSTELAERAQAASNIIEPRNQDRSRPLLNRFSAMRGAGGTGGRGRRWWPT